MPLIRDHPQGISWPLLEGLELPRPLLQAVSQTASRPCHSFLHPLQLLHVLPEEQAPEPGPAPGKGLCREGCQLPDAPLLAQLQVPRRALGVWLSLPGRPMPSRSPFPPVSLAHVLGAWSQGDS